MENKFFKVTCKCGHVGRNHFVRISFPIIAQNAKDAAGIARYIARVKHDHKDAILDCVEISKEEYAEILEANGNDPYLRCSNPQEQEAIEGFSSRIEDEPSFLKSKKKKESKRNRNVSYKIKKQKEANDCLKAELNEFVQRGIEYELFAY